jgi:hypothetical protein
MTETDPKTKHRVQSLPSGFWADSSNRKKFFDVIASEFNVRSPEDWYKIRKEDILKSGGDALLRDYYGSSVVAGTFKVFL